MKTNTSFTPNKKLILHFDVDQVLKFPSNIDKDFIVMHLTFRSMNYVPDGYGGNFKKHRNKILIKLQAGK